MCWRPLRILLREPSGPSCEIVSDLCPNPFSHDWHVQPSCQRPNRLPPERCVFSPVKICGVQPKGRNHRTAFDCPRNLLTISPAENPVNACVPQNFHQISTRGIPFRTANGEAVSSFGFQVSKSKPEPTCFHARSDMRLPP